MAIGGPRRYLIDEIAADMNSGHNVAATVFVDCFSMYTEGVTVGLGVALSLCTAAHPLHTIFTNIFGAAISEATMRPDRR
jgi:hypothetical protein